MLAMAVETLGKCPLKAQCLAVSANAEPSGLLEQAREMILQFDGGDVIVLTDLFGSTPSNIASRLVHEFEGLVLISGLNIPMLIRLLNYAGQEKDVLVQKAITGGRDGIFVFNPECND
jgi:PTS system ascorbate-specific IIA component